MPRRSVPLRGAPTHTYIWACAHTQTHPPHHHHAHRTTHTGPGSGSTFRPAGPWCGDAAIGPGQKGTLRTPGAEGQCEHVGQDLARLGSGRWPPGPLPAQGQVRLAEGGGLTAEKRRRDREQGSTFRHPSRRHESKGCELSKELSLETSSQIPADPQQGRARQGPQRSHPRSSSQQRALRTLGV